MNIRSAKPGDILQDKDGDVWYFDGDFFWCAVVAGAVNNRAIPTGLDEVDELAIVGPFMRLVPEEDVMRAEAERDVLRDRVGKLTVADLQRESYETACVKGWHDDDETPPSPIRVIAWMGLICSEAAEAIEDVRKGRMTTTIREDGKPEGFGSELADVIIRACDTAGAMGIDLEAELRAKLAFNLTRDHKHGGKLA